MRRRLPIRVGDGCREDWSAMPREGDGRRCARCETVVVDLSGVTRSRAEAILRERGGRICGRLRTDERGEAVFAPEPTRRGLTPVALAGLLAACAPDRGPEPVETPAPPAEPATFGQPTTAAFGGSLATGTMMPIGLAPEPEPILLASLPPVVDEGPPTPTPEQRDLTRRKRHERWRRAHPPPIVHHWMGMMALPD